jgi:hypothetical protein
MTRSITDPDVSRRERDAVHHAASQARGLVDPYAELASLFLTDGPEAGLGAAPTSTAPEERPRSSPAAAPERPTAVVASRAPIEIAIAGNLPVMAGLWLSQYADRIGQREGPTALVRLERGQISLELFRAPEHRGRLEATTSLEDALDLLAEVARRFVFVPQHEGALDGPLPGDALSLLTGADDAATVAAYRTIKQLAERWGIAGWPVPPIGLVVFGAPPERVTDVAEKLDAATRAFLDVAVAVVGHVQRMDAVDACGRRAFTVVEGVPEPTVHDLVRRLRAERRVGARLSPPQQPMRSDGQPDLKPDLKPDVRIGAPAAVHHPIPVAAGVTELRPPLKLGPKPGPGATPAGGRSIGREVVAPRIVRHDDRFAPPLASPRTPSAPAAAAARDEGGQQPDRPVRTAERPPLAQRIHVEGGALVPLPIACPAHPLVELAADLRGGLHLVVPFEAMASLRPAEAWARAHMDLLRRACPQLVGTAGAVDPTRDAITSHVVTSDAPAIVPLHGTGIRLHLVVATNSGHEPVVVPLNRTT